MSARTGQLTDSLEDAFAVARDEGDSEALARLFARASESERDPRAEAFMLTQAYAYGLEAGLAEAAVWHERLCTLGADHREPG